MTDAAEAQDQPLGFHHIVWNWRASPAIPKATPRSATTFWRRWTTNAG